MKSALKFLILTTICLTLNACASGARPERMTATPDENYEISRSNKYFKSISIENVTGGKDTHPLLASKVSNTAFYESLKSSLDAYGLLSTGNNGKYKLNSELLALEQPMIGFSFTVDSVASYKLQKISNNNTVFNETIKAAGTATMGDTLLGVERLRMANEYSVKNNIQTFIDQLAK